MCEWAEFGLRIAEWNGETLWSFRAISECFKIASFSGRVRQSEPRRGPTLATVACWVRQAGVVTARFAIWSTPLDVKIKFFLRSNSQIARRTVRCSAAIR